MHYEIITTEEQLEQCCRRLSGRQHIALDTEFVSEHTYRPVLCLAQVAAGEELAVIDALALKDMTPFWQMIAGPGHATIVHAGRGEVEFCLGAVGRVPAEVFDVQVAAGLVGIGYPAAYGTLLGKLLGAPSQKPETRTEWRRRPLSQRQMEYALDDVRHLLPLRDILHARLCELGRTAWLEEEMATWQDEIQRALSAERWRRISGISGLDRRSLAIARELYHWRQGEAQRRNQPARRVLRDDLIVELARRQTADIERIRAVRGLERGDLRRRLEEIAACTRRALELSEAACPVRIPRDQMPQLSVLGQFLFVALGSLCRQAQLAPNLVGGPNDIRELIALRTSQGNDLSDRRRPPRLARGWRREFLGHFFDDLLAGKISVRIGDFASQQPLVFESGNRGLAGDQGCGPAGLPL